MGQPGEVFVCPRLPHILQHARQDNTRKDGGLWFCKAQIMLYVSPGWGPVFTMGLNVSSGRQQLKFHQYHLSSLGWTNSVVSPLKLILGQLAYVTRVKLGASFDYSQHIQLLLFIFLPCLRQSFWVWFWLFCPLPLGIISFYVSHFCSKGSMTILCICVGTGHKSYETEFPQRSLPKPVWKKSTEGTEGHLHKGTFFLLVDSIRFILLVLQAALWIPASALNAKKIQ